MQDDIYAYIIFFYHAIMSTQKLSDKIIQLFFFSREFPIYIYNSNKPNLISKK